MRKILLTFFTVSLTIVSAYAASDLDGCIKPNDGFCADGDFLSGDCCYSCTQGNYCDGKYETECPEDYPESDEGAKRERECYTTCNVEQIYMGYRGNLKAYYHVNECGDDTTTITCVENAKFNASKTGCECIDGYVPNPTSNTCEPETITITLNPNGYMFNETKLIYNQCKFGFTDDPVKDIWRLSPPQKLSLWWGQEFKGYYTSPDQDKGTQVITAQFQLAEGYSTCSFASATTLYAHWSQNPYKVIYNYNDKDSIPDTKTCYLGTDYYTPKKTKTENEITEYIDYWECTRGCSTSNLKIASGDKIPAPVVTGNETPPPTDTPILELTAHWTDCEAGYYCINGQKYPCPEGTTSSSGTSSVHGCYIGNNETVFQNADGSTFTLPNKYYLIK